MTNLRPWHDEVTAAVAALFAADAAVKRLAARPPLRRKGINRCRGERVAARFRVQRAQRQMTAAINAALAGSYLQ